MRSDASIKLSAERLGPGSPEAVVDYKQLPAPADPSEVPKRDQREAFCMSFVGPRSVAEFEFEKWWSAHHDD